MNATHSLAPNPALESSEVIDLSASRSGRLRTFNIVMGLVHLVSGALMVVLGNDFSLGVSTFNFNGGTLKARASEAAFLTGLDTANVQSGGAIIDTDGFDITVGQNLLNGGGGGGLFAKRLAADQFLQCATAQHGGLSRL